MEGVLNPLLPRSGTCIPCPVFVCLFLREHRQDAGSRLDRNPDASISASGQ
jgi:hypothetical protein